jgi:nucleotidyltransferase substrate binding protein (TIGR01987 family)
MHSSMKFMLLSVFLDYSCSNSTCNLPFEFSFELLWKCVKEYLYVEEGIDAASPKKVIRCCRELGLLDEGQPQEALQMADDRNLTSHTYDETFAQAVVERIRHYDPLLQFWLDKIGCVR